MNNAQLMPKLPNKSDILISTTFLKSENKETLFIMDNCALIFFLIKCTHVPVTYDSFYKSFCRLFECLFYV